MKTPQLNAEAERRMLLKRVCLSVLGCFALLVARQTSAGPAAISSGGWRQYITTHKWDAGVVTRPGNIAPFDGTGPGYTWTVGCGLGRYIEAVSSRPYKPAGGWAEYWLYDHPNPNIQLKNSAPSTGGREISRVCPRMWNETADQHQHGVSAFSLAVWKDQIYSTYVAKGRYFGGDRLQFQESPEVTGPGMGNARRPFTIAGLWRNNRNYADLNPMSPNYVGKPACVPSSGDLLPSLKRVNPNWALDTGIDQEGTQCGVYAQTQIETPDIDIRATDPEFNNGLVTIAWAERYVALRNATRLQLDPTIAVGTDNDPLRIHVERFAANTIQGGHALETSPGANDQTPHTALTDGNGLNRNAGTNAWAPRVATWNVNNTGDYRAVVAWTEQQTYAPLPTGGAPGGSPQLYVSMHAGGDVSTSWSALGGSLGTVCSIKTGTSGRASGNHEFALPNHDIGVMRVAGVEYPVVIASLSVAGTCQLRVKRWTGTSPSPTSGSWVDVGPNGNVSDASDPTTPRIVVKEDVPYVTYAAITGSVSPYDINNPDLDAIQIDLKSHVYVKRFDAANNRWDSLATRWDPQNPGQFYEDSAHRPSIAIGAVTATSADVYALFLEQAPGANDAANPGYFGVYGAVVKKCTAISTPLGWRCQGDPAPFHSGAGPAFEGEYGVGASLGLGAAELRWPNANEVGVSGPGGDAHAIATANSFDGPTDLLINKIAGDGQPYSMWAGWIGAVQTHRNYDLGLKVRQYTPYSTMPLGLTDLIPNGLTASIYNSYMWNLPKAGLTLPSGWRNHFFALGYNGYGTLGDGTSTTKTSLVEVTTPFPVKHMAGGALHTCAVSDAGLVYCWGKNGEFELGNANANTTYRPASPIDGLSNVASISAGNYHTCALLNDGTAKCWGQGTSGELGDGKSIASGPVTVLDENRQTLRYITQIVAGASHTCAIAQGAMYCWGANGYGQLGDATTVNRGLATLVWRVKDTAVEAALGAYHTCVLVDTPQDLEGNYNVECFGYNADGEYANGSVSSTTPVRVATGDALAVRTAQYNTCILRQDIVHEQAGLTCTGYDGYGAVGDGAPYASVNSFKSVALPRLSRLHQTGMSNTFYAVDEKGALMAWGYNGYGQLMNGNTRVSSSPAPVASAAPAPWLQFPWKSSGRTPAAYNQPAAGTFGYSFTANSPATVQQLCAYVNGTAVVHLWNQNTGAELASATVTSDAVSATAPGTWGCASIAPVALTGGGKYIVAGYMATGYNYVSDVSYPRTSGPITIDGYVYAGGDARPTTTYTYTYMFGQVDIGFTAPGCADGTAEQVFNAKGSGYMVGCAATVTFDNKANACAEGYEVCSAKDWNQYRGQLAPTHNYWTRDKLGYSGSGPNACAATTSGVTFCGATTPMRVCSGLSDTENNVCNWTGCGLDTTTNQYFGGCAGNTTAGVLCCPRL